MNQCLKIIGIRIIIPYLFYAKIQKFYKIFQSSRWNGRRRNFYSVKVENYFWGRSAGFMLR
jgi:hypothetical protein